EVEAVGKADGQGWILRLEHVTDPSALRPSPSVLPGGPPWLTAPAPTDPVPGEEDTAEPVEDEPAAAEQAGPVPAPAGEGPLRLEPDRAVRELAEANRDRRDRRDERGSLHAKLDEIAGENVRLRAALERARSRPTTPAKTRQPATATPREDGLFIDPEDQLRYEV